MILPVLLPLLLGAGYEVESLNIRLKNVEDTFTTPEKHGAKGNYDPATGSGDDDTAALQAAISSGKSVRMARGKIYKVTSTLSVPNGTTIEGAGYRSSFLWCALADVNTDCLQLGPAASSGWGVQLLSFGVVGGATPGRSAIASYGLSNSVIDVYAAGGWEYLFRIWRVASGIDGPEGGDFVTNHLRLWHQSFDTGLPFSAAICPNPKRGIYIRGWANASDIWANIGTTTVGDGLHLEGTYSAANNTRIRGTYQGVAGWGVYVGGEANILTRLEDVHAEVTGSGGVYLGTSNAATLRNIYGSVTIDGATDAEVGTVSGTLTITAASRRTRIVGAVMADTAPVENASPTTTSSAFPISWDNGGIRSVAQPAPSSDVNLIVNGDFARFLSTVDGAATSVWGVSGYYTATKTGVGLSDTARTSESAYAAKFAYRAGWGKVAYFPIFDAAAVSTTWVGMPVTASFKFKSATPGVGTLSVTEMAGNAIGAGYGSVVDSAGVDAGDGWKRYSFTFFLTAAHITNGVGLQFAFNNVGGEPAYYISEVQAVLGVSAPRAFLRRTRDRLNLVEVLPGGRLESFGSAAPSAGGDPVFNSTWRPGDVVWNAAPTSGSAVGWRNVGAGSPGTWEAMYVHTTAP